MVKKMQICICIIKNNHYSESNKKPGSLSPALINVYLHVRPVVCRGRMSVYLRFVFFVVSSASVEAPPQICNWSSYICCNYYCINAVKRNKQTLEQMITCQTRSYKSASAIFEH